MSPDIFPFHAETHTEINVKYILLYVNNRKPCISGSFCFFDIGASALIKKFRT